MSEDRQIFSLKQVVSSIRKTIEERYQSLYWVKAEVHKLNLYPSGHAFPELVQKEDGKIVAQINGSIWKHNFERINQRFVQVVKEPMKEGSTMLLQVRVTYHETFGMSLQILDIDTSYSLGELQRERQETLERLQKLQLLNKNQSLSFPLLPQRIAVISAESSKGLSDFYKVIRNNQWNYAFFTYLFPANLQGDVAISSIQKQLDLIRKVQHHFDLVVIVRGGGGEVGMSCYNNFELCKSIAEFPLPILTGIGHSTNLTVAEMIAYRNAITPTELGEFLLQAFHEFSVPVHDAQKSLIRTSRLVLERSWTNYTQATKEVKSQVQGLLKEHDHQLIRLTTGLTSKTNLNLKRQSERITFLSNQLESNSLRTLKNEREDLEDVQTDLTKLSLSPITQSVQLVAQLEKTVGLLDPKNVLKRGYSIARYKGQTIKENNRPVVQDSIEIQTFETTIEATVTKIKEDHE